MNQQDYWEKKHSKYKKESWIDKPSIFAKQAIKFFPKRGRILDLAAGQGQDTRFFASKGFKVVSSDFSKFAVGLSKKKTQKSLSESIQFKIVDMSKPLPFPKESFDVVYSHMGLHYFDDIRTSKLFGEIYKTLKTGGIFATITNTSNDPEKKAGKRLGEGYYLSDGIKKRFFSIPYMRKATKTFEPILLDEKGRTYKDDVFLVRFIGRKL